MDRLLRKFLFGYFLVSRAMLLPTLAGAQPVTRTPDAGPAVPGAAHRVVVVTLASVLDGAQALGALVSELLGRHAVDVELNEQGELHPQDLVAVPKRGASARAQIWISLPNPTRALLFFGQPEQNRYLVREIPLRSGLDELGREKVAQVVESATLALLEGAPALSRQEIRLQLEASPAPANQGSVTAPAESSPGTPGAKTPPAARPPIAEPAPAAFVDSSSRRIRPGPQWGIRPRFAVGYLAAWSGPAQRELHGPSLQAGVSMLPLHALSPWRWPLFIAWEVRFPQMCSYLGLHLRTQSHAVWLLSGIEYVPPSRWGAHALFGPGVEFTNSSITVDPGTQASPAPNGSKQIPWVRLAWGANLHLGKMVLRATAITDFSLYATEYKISRDGVLERAFAPWWVRPGLQISGDFF